MLVDPDILRAFAGQVDRVSASITDADIDSKTSTAADALAGSATQWGTHAVGGHFSQLADHLAQQVTRMGQAVRGAGNAYQVADDDLARDFKGLF